MTAELTNAAAEIKEYDISDAEKICERCRSEMVCIGYDSYREIEYIPAVVKVIEHRKKKDFFGYLHCDGLRQYEKKNPKDLWRIFSNSAKKTKG